MSNEGPTPNATPGPPLTSGLDVLLAFVARYGLATVLTVVLLGYLLWTDYTRQSVLVPVIESVADNQAAITRNQADIAASLKDLQVQMRLSCGPSR